MTSYTRYPHAEKRKLGSTFSLPGLSHRYVSDYRTFATLLAPLHYNGRHLSILFTACNTSGAAEYPLPPRRPLRFLLSMNRQNILFVRRQEYARSNYLNSCRAGGTDLRAN
jgi:hypothetical protein